MIAVDYAWYIFVSYVAHRDCQFIHTGFGESAANNGSVVQVKPCVSAAPVQQGCDNTWWHHDMETSSVLLSLCEGNPLVTSGFPSQRDSNVR